MKILFLNCSVLVVLACACLADDIPIDNIVSLTKGSLRGTYQTSRKGRQYHAFLGIRYAEPPMGDYRFKPPLPAYQWGGVRNATEYGTACYQSPNSNLPPLSEDCLFLDVFSNDLKGNAPVIVYIHASSMVSGYKHKYGPEMLMDQNIVWVSINYRLGPLGFISTGNSDAPGNYALKDQREALRWVRDNIKSFGGDPDNVTLMGQSAGSMCVTLQVISPSSRGLIHKAIAMSGSGVSHFETDNIRWTRDIASNLDCYSENTATLVKCLRTKSAEDLIDAASRLPYPEYEMILRWNYEIEDPDSNDPFLTKEPRDHMLEGDFARIPILTGFTKDESAFMGSAFYNNEQLRGYVDHNFAETIPIALSFSHHPKAVSISAALRDYYLPSHQLTSENVKDFGYMFSDSMLTHGGHLFADRARRFTNVYYYQSNYGGVDSRKDDYGVPTIYHTGDMHFLLSRYTTAVGLDDVDNFMVERLTGWWTHFAATGDPNDSDNFWTNATNWEPSNVTNLVQLNINVNNSLTEEYYANHFALWDRIFNYK